MLTLQPYQYVCISDLRYPLETYDGWRVNQRPPAIGDVGILIDVLEARGYPNKYVVESSDHKGVTIWLADFDAEELRPIDLAEYTARRKAIDTANAPE